MIRFIVETASSSMDAIGKYHHLVKVTSTLSGRSLCFALMNDDYTLYCPIQIALGLPGNTPVVHAIDTTLPIREWRRAHARMADLPLDCAPSTSTLLELEQP